MNVKGDARGDKWVRNCPRGARVLARWRSNGASLRGRVVEINFDANKMTIEADAPDGGIFEFQIAGFGTEDPVISVVSIVDEIASLDE